MNREKQQQEKLIENCLAHTKSLNKRQTIKTVLIFQFTHGFSIRVFFLNKYSNLYKLIAYYLYVFLLDHSILRCFCKTIR